MNRPSAATRPELPPQPPPDFEQHGLPGARIIPVFAVAFAALLTAVILHV